MTARQRRGVMVFGPPPCPLVTSARRLDLPPHEGCSLFKRSSAARHWLTLLGWRWSTTYSGSRWAMSC